jgi:hypothetical protein
VTAEEARLLAGLLHRNFQQGGADFVVTAPYSGAVVTLTGQIDFAESVGRAEAVTAFASDRADDVRTVFFTADDLWTGDLPALTDALAVEAPGTTFLRRPLSDDDEPLLIDVLAHMLLRLSAASADQPEAFLGRDYTWEGQRSIDSRLTSLFGLPLGTVAVGAADDLLRQFAAPVADGAVDVTVTLTDHGPRTVELPADTETAQVADHPEIAQNLGI